MCSSVQAIAFSFWGQSRKIEPWFSTMKSGPIDSVGEVPDATNESCEDIIPPVKRRCLRKLWGGTKVGFAPYRPYPFFQRLAPWLFCGSVAGALTARPLLIL